MPKLKTRKSVAKRFKITGTGKVIHHRSGKSHILTKKSAKRKRRLAKPKVLEGTQAKMIKKMLPYA
ncbi:MAG TPA: 50S ribosomal protein L35 [bacterium]|nr:50S ribosomal protein L35 [bacterium]HPO52318.1 50S ribosomal protein L35 [bacterium]HXK44992.1 50S ribosomal protein L35 [bacterium]